MKQIEKIRWFIFVLMWGVIGTAGIFYLQKKFFNIFCLSLFLLVCLIIIFYWFTVRKENDNDNNEDLPY